MMNKLLLALAVLSSCFAETVSEASLSRPPIHLLPSYWQATQIPTLINQIMTIVSTNAYCLKPAPIPFNEEALREMMQKEASTLNIAVINKVISTLKCAENYNIQHNHILTVIDYSLPSSEKRLWILDLNENKLLFHTYVSHGIKSGELLTNSFSNKNNSKSTSIGVYTTEKAYYGRDGLSLRLDGLDRGFNDNASGRSIVMHGSWYVEEQFIKKYGRAGRSWGCPAVPIDLSKQIINTIKDKSIVVAYYPSDVWFAKSKFLKCDHTPTAPMPGFANSTQPAINAPTDDNREEVLFVAPSKHNMQLDTRPVLAISADKYEQIFHTKAPLTRMLRRQINSVEYIALSNTEFKSIALNHYKTRETPQNKNSPPMFTYASTTQPNVPNDDLESVQLVSPMLKMIRGYYETQMNIVNLGKIKNVITNAADSYTLHFEKNAIITLHATNQFVRWVGL